MTITKRPPKNKTLYEYLTVYLKHSRKFITTSEHLKSFEVDSSRHAAAKSSQVESDVLKSTAMDLGSF